MFDKLKANPKILLTLSIALAIVTVASASLVSRSSRTAFVTTRSAAALFPTPCIDSFTVGSTGSLGTLQFAVKFEDITTQKLPQVVRLTLRPTSGSDIVNTVVVNSDSSGIWTGMLLNSIPFGTYTIFVKGPAHLQKNFGQVIFNSTQTVTQDWTATPLKSGDIACAAQAVCDTYFYDNHIEINDLNLMISEYKYSTPTVSIADLNQDGYVELRDLVSVIQNYTFSTPGDQ